MQTASAKERAEAAHAGIDRACTDACAYCHTTRALQRSEAHAAIDLALAAARVEVAEEMLNTSNRVRRYDAQSEILARLRADLDKFNKETKP